MEGGALGLGQSSALPQPDAVDQPHQSTPVQGNEDIDPSYPSFSENGAGTKFQTIRRFIQFGEVMLNTVLESYSHHCT